MLFTIITLVLFAVWFASTVAAIACPFNNRAFRAAVALTLVVMVWSCGVFAWVKA